MGKGYAEGPAAEERFEELERSRTGARVRTPLERSAVYGSTSENPERHLIGWLGEVDPDELFAAGDVWGLSVRRVRDDAAGA